MVLLKQRLPIHDREKLVFEGEGQVEPALFYLLAQKFTVAIDEPERNLRVGSPASFNEWPDQGRGKGSRHSYADQPLDIAAAGAHQTWQIFVPAQDRGSFLVKSLPGRRRLDPSRTPLQKGDAERGLQFGDLLAECRLRHVDGTRRLRETPRFDNFHEIKELAVVHPPFLDRYPFYRC